MNIPKILAFYLPQYHQIPENDKWWGKGFTDWVSTKNAKPLFEGHNQPRKPLDDRYYDLMDHDVMKWQADMAYNYHVDGFIFYHYWFGNGKIILEKPAENLLKWKDVPMNYCFSWANETWARTWSNIQKREFANMWSEVDEPEVHEDDSGILLEQVYGDEDEWIRHIEYLMPFFSDNRYLKENGKPIFVIHKPYQITCLNDMISIWNKYVKKHGFPGIYVIGGVLDLSKYSLYKQYQLDAVFMRFPTIQTREKSISSTTINGVKLWDYDTYWQYILNKDWSKYAPCYLAPSVDYDDTPRRGRKNGMALCGVSVDKFSAYFKKLVQNCIQSQQKYIMINAWNEWGEGSYLEPDKTNRYGYLESIRDAVDEMKCKSEEKREVLISVIIPVYNKEPYLKKCLDSVVNQKFDFFEVICIDDGSTDSSRRILEYYKEKYSCVRVLFQKNRGPACARNYGVQHAKGKYITYLDADDYFTTKDALLTMWNEGGKDNLDALFFGVDATSHNKEVARYYSRKRSYGVYDYGYELFRAFIRNEDYITVACGILIRRHFLLYNNIKFKEGMYNEDALYSFQVIMNAKKVRHINEALYYYRYVPNSRENSKINIDRFVDNVSILIEIKKIKDSQHFPEWVNSSIDEYMHRRRNMARSMYLQIKNQGIEIWKLSVERYSMIKWFLNDTLMDDYKHEKNSEIVFPYHLFNQGCRVVIYGACDIAKKLYYSAEKNQYLSIMAVVDDQFENISTRRFPVENPVILKSIVYDAVLIASKDKTVVDCVADKLIGWGIDSNKIIWHFNTCYKENFLNAVYFKLLNKLEQMV